jgi:hypothetical protein
MNKKGAEMAIGTIIVIILALVVLVVLIYGFTTGWGNLWDKITGVGGGKENVQSVVDSCRVACTTQAKYDYCQRMRDITFKDSNNILVTVSATCKLVQDGASVPTIKPAGGNAQIPAAGLMCDLNCQ